MVCWVIVNSESEDYLGMQINKSTRKKLVRQRGVCVPRIVQGAAASQHQVVQAGMFYASLRLSLPQEN